MKILIVDDREDNLYMLETLLEGNGFSVRKAREGSEALHLARESMPDLVISDILMPGMDGFALCSEWKKDAQLRRIPFVFYTATYTDPKDERLAVNMGADRFILKPAEPDDFLKEINDVLTEYSMTPDAIAREPKESEMVVMKEYNEALVRKLEDKLEQIESMVEELDENEKRLDHINRVLRGIRAVNQLIVKEKDRACLIEEACSRLVHDRGYEGAWIVLHGESHRMLWSQAGFEEKTFSGLVDLFGNGGLPPCCLEAAHPEDVIVLPGDSPIHRKCPMPGICGKAGSLIAPLICEGAAFGHLAVSLPPHISADDEEVSLFREMVGDVAYSLHHMGIEEERKRSDDLLRATFESANDGIMLADVDSRSFIRVNRTMCEMLGYSQEEMEKLHIHDIHPVEDLPGVLADFEKQVSGDSPLAVDIPLMRKDGTIFFADVNTSRLVVDGKQHVLGMFRDVTQRRETEKKEREAVERLRRALRMTIHVLSQTLERRDPYTAGHQRRVAALAGAIAAEMGLDQEIVDGITMAGQVHDIGKVSVPAEILSKPGILSPLEMNIIREHPSHGRDILCDVDSAIPLGEIVFQHHERLDGSGYPRGLKDGEILLEARILTVADVVEAMASHRPYRPSRGIDIALVEIEKNSGILYDKEVADVCLRLFREKGYILVD